MDKELIKQIATKFHANVHPDKLHDTMSGEKSSCVNCISVWLEQFNG